MGKASTQSDSGADDGCINILHAQGGHIEIHVKGKGKKELAAVRDKIEALLKQGFLLSAKNKKGEDVLIKRFDRKIDCYILVGAPEDEKLSLKKTKVTAVPPTAGG